MNKDIQRYIQKIAWIASIHVYRQDTEIIQHGRIQEMIITNFTWDTSLNDMHLKAQIKRDRMKMIPYAQIIRSIMYVILYIRTYISYALNIMSRYQFILVEGH